MESPGKSAPFLRRNFVSEKSELKYVSIDTNTTHEYTNLVVKLWMGLLPGFTIPEYLNLTDCQFSALVQESTLDRPITLLLIFAKFEKSSVIKALLLNGP